MQFTNIISRASLTAVGLCFASVGLGADAGKSPKTASLSDELASLAPSGQVTTEKYHVAQDRHFNMANAVEASIGAGTNVSSNVYVNSRQVSGALAYHINNRFYLKGAGARVRNTLTASGERLFDDEAVAPNVSFVESRYDLTAGFNLMYGKARITQDSVFYFDQFIALGAGRITQKNGFERSTTNSYVGDVGIAFWFGDRTSLTFGVKDHYYLEKRVLDESRVHDIVAYSTLGVLMGGSKI